MERRAAPGPQTTGGILSSAQSERRPYDSPLRRQRAAETRERIIDAGAELIHQLPIWQWQALTIRAVADRAEVHVRTVYRHFSTERNLRAAILHKLRKEADVHVEDVGLDEVTELTARMWRFVSAFPIAPRTPRDESVSASNRRQRDALRGAVAAEADGWTKDERAIAAAVLDVLWSVVSYERLVTDWEMEPEAAIRAATWAIGLVEDAIHADRRP